MTSLDQKADICKQIVIIFTLIGGRGDYPILRAAT